MAIQTKDHGDTKPVFAIDTLNGTGSNPTGTPVMFSGPKLEFFGLDLGASPAGQLVTNGAVEKVITCITQLATTHFYQVEGSDAANNMSIAIYPVAAWTAGSLQTAIRALGTVNGYDLSGTVVTNVGFKLAAA